MDYAYDADHYLITGTNGTGKSTCAERLIKAHRAIKCFGFDHQREFADRLGVKPVFYRDELPEAVEKEKYICYDPSYEWDDFREGWAWYCKFVYDFAEQFPEMDKLLFCDEIQDMETPHVQDEYQGKIIMNQRKKKMNTLFCGQQLNLINGVTKNQVSEVYLFAQCSEISAQQSKDYGVDPDEVRKLQKLEFFYINRAELAAPERGKLEI